MNKIKTGFTLLATGALSTLIYQYIRKHRYKKIDFIQSYVYDKSLYTQGIEIVNGQIIVSTGLYGESKVGYLDPFTGYLDKVVYLDSQYFGEGMTFDGEYFWQLTWKEGTVFVRDPDTLEVVKTFNYTEEGWGLCFDGTQFIMSDGSQFISFRDAKDFSVIRRLEVKDRFGRSFSKINELEYVDGILYANVFKSNLILKIDASTGIILKIYDSTKLVKDAMKFADENFNVLNGIAHLEGNKFLISGKKWPRIYLVELN